MIFQLNLVILLLDYILQMLTLLEIYLIMILVIETMLIYQNLFLLLSMVPLLFLSFYIFFIHISFILTIFTYHQANHFYTTSHIFLFSIHLPDRSQLKLFAMTRKQRKKLPRLKP